MKRITVVLGIAALAALLPLTPALAETTLYKIDPNHSVVGFSIRHLFSKVPGRFNDFEGTIQFDDKNMAASSVETTIKTASIFTRARSSRKVRSRFTISRSWFIAGP